MALKILTGILKVKGRAHSANWAHGSATIYFRPFSVTGDAQLVDECIYGDPQQAYDYVDPPGKVVSMRQFMVHGAAPGNDYFRINDGKITDGTWNNQHLEVTWHCSDADSKIMEMTVLIVGEAEEPEAKV